MSKQKPVTNLSAKHKIPVHSLIDTKGLAAIHHIDRDVCHPLSHCLDLTVRFKSSIANRPGMGTRVQTHDFYIAHVQYNHKNEPILRGYAVDRDTGEVIDTFGRCINPLDVEIVK